MSTKIWLSRPEGSREAQMEKLREALDRADSVVIGAGSGLSTASGFTYSGERFDRWFSDFSAKYGFTDMYTGGFNTFDSTEEFWGFWSRFIFVNRYLDPPKDTYQNLLELVKGKEFFVITTNVDHCFQKAGFPKDRLFYTQGDYGLLQCSKPCHAGTYDNEAMVMKMLEAQGYVRAEDGTMTLPKGVTPTMTVPTELLPVCPRCGRPMSMNLRGDDRFVEDEGWQAASRRYSEFLEEHRDGRILYLELGVGFNTPVIIKYPFWRWTAHNPKAVYACLNFNEAYCPENILEQSICISGDTDTALKELLR